MSKVRIIGNYRVYRGSRHWNVMNTKSNAIITRHADLELAIAAAERYAAADQRRANAQRSMHYLVTGSMS